MSAIPPSSNACSWPATTRGMLARFAITLVVNTVCAIVVTYVIHLSKSIWISWVFSMCIGTMAWLLIDGGRLAMWRQRKPSRIGMIAIVVSATPIAYVCGSLIATEILGLPARLVYDRQIDHATEMLIFITLVCLFVSWFHWSRAELSALKAQAEVEKARSAAVEKQAMQAQLQLLQAQIEPHMLFNTLANVQGLIAIDAARAQHMLDQLILYLRASLSSARADKTTLAHEFELMRAYLELMSVRIGSRLSYSLQLPESHKHAAIPPMLLQPLLENAIKHGIEPSMEGGHVTVQAVQEGGKLIISVADTGLGLATASDLPDPNRGAGVGLENVRERLLALFGEQATFFLYPNKPRGAVAKLTLPANHD